MWTVGLIWPGCSLAQLKHWLGSLQTGLKHWQKPHIMSLTMGLKPSMAYQGTEAKLCVICPICAYMIHGVCCEVIYYLFVKQSRTIKVLK